MKKLLLLSLLSLSLCNPLSVHAETNIISSDIIPDEMEPATEITFTDETHYVIDKGGISTHKMNLNSPNTMKKLTEAKENGTYYTALHGELPNPVKGLKVFYADDGFILKMVYPKGVENPLLKEANSSNQDITIPSTKSGPGPKDVLIAHWGAHNNQLYKINNSKTARLGIGRATTFSDKYGQMGNLLKKGDVATSLKYDNCKFGTTLRVTICPKGSTIPFTNEMIKSDIGGMPDAVLDIWKTGVEYWGYKWTSTLSIKDAQYIHG